VPLDVDGSAPVVVESAIPVLGGADSVAAGPDELAVTAMPVALVVVPPTRKSSVRHPPSSTASTSTVPERYRCDDGGWPVEGLTLA
jgi:hypothetical protein